MTFSSSKLNIKRKRVDTNSFYIDAIHAANKSLEAFIDEFKRPDANPNADDGDDEFGPQTLVYTLIRELPEETVLPILRFLITQKVNLDPAKNHETTNKYCFPAHVLAARHGKHETLKLLIAAEAKLNTKEKLAPAICNAIEHRTANSLAIIKDLIENYQADIDTPDQNEWTPLMYAASDGEYDFLSYLISKKANLFVMRSDGRTALAAAYHAYFICNRMYFNQNPPSLINRRNCLMLLTDAAKKHFDQKALYWQGSEEELKAALTKDLLCLTGNWSNSDTTSPSLQEFLNEHILEPLLKRFSSYIREVFLAFLQAAENCKLDEVNALILKIQNEGVCHIGMVINNARTPGQATPLILAADLPRDFQTNLI
jgi:hypothetical protein